MLQTEAKLKLPNEEVFEPKIAQVDENKNEPCRFLPTVVSNFFDMISEEDPTHNAGENVLDDNIETGKHDQENAGGKVDDEVFDKEK